MLSDEVLDKIIERLVNRMEKANEHILKAIGESINEIGTINPSKLNQLIMSLKYGSNYKSMIKKLEEYTELNQKEIEEIFDEVAKSDYKFAEKYYKYKNRRYVPYRENKALIESTRAMANITANELMNLSNTTSIGFGFQTKDGIQFKGLKETYYDLLDEAVISVHQGKEVFDSAMYRQLKQIGESGLKVIYPTTYIGKDGKEHHYVRRLDSAMRMNLKGALRNLHNETQKIIGEQIDADGIEINVHSNPAPDHADAQGKQFSNEEFEKLQTTGRAKTYDGVKISLHRGHSQFRPISEWNCYHYVFSINLGIDKPQFTQEYLDEIKEKNDEGFTYEGEHYTMYEGTQLQRQIETEIRKQKEAQLLGEKAGNEQLIQEARKKARILSKKYRELCNISGLQSRVDRMRI